MRKSGCACVCVWCDLAPSFRVEQAQPASQAGISMVRDVTIIPSASGGVGPMWTLVQQSDRQWEREILEHEIQPGDSVHSHQSVIPPNSSPPRQQEETGAVLADLVGEKRLCPAVMDDGGSVSLADLPGQKAPAGASSLPAAATEHRIAAALAGGGGGLVAKRRRFTTKCWECEHGPGASPGVSVQWCRYVLRHTGPETRSSDPWAQPDTAAMAESDQVDAAADPSRANLNELQQSREGPPVAGVAGQDEPFRLVYCCFCTELVCSSCHFSSSSLVDFVRIML